MRDKHRAASGEQRGIVETEESVSFDFDRDPVAALSDNGSAIAGATGN